MKIFYFLIPILILLTGCKYGSYKEASDACEEWAEKGGKYSIKNYLGYIIELEIRDCLREDVTKKILGVEYAMESRFYENPPSRSVSDSKVKKRFKY